MEHKEQKDPVAQSTSVHSTTPAVDFSKETLFVKEEETYDAGAFERVEAEGEFDSVSLSPFGQVFPLNKGAFLM